ncbi:MAG: hypothetical protein HQL46_05635 [Gammaproteobacteria bacterium]|nr:hypothetical protein [Gammaproteobacteria bacterium]
MGIVFILFKVIRIRKNEYITINNMNKNFKEALEKVNNIFEFHQIYLKTEVDMTKLPISLTKKELEKEIFKQYAYNIWVNIVLKKPYPKLLKRYENHGTLEMFYDELYKVMVPEKNFFYQPIEDLVFDLGEE